MPGTSPAIAIQPDGGWEVAFQSQQGDLWLLNSNSPTRPHNTGLGMDRRSSPAIAALPSDSVDDDYEIAIQVANHSLYTVNDDGSANYGQVVPGAELRHGTSPSINAFVGDA